MPIEFNSEYFMIGEGRNKNHHHHLLLLFWFFSKFKQVAFITMEKTNKYCRGTAILVGQQSNKSLELWLQANTCLFCVADFFCFFQRWSRHCSYIHVCWVLVDVHYSTWKIKAELSKSRRKETRLSQTSFILLFQMKNCNFEGDFFAPVKSYMYFAFFFVCIGKYNFFTCSSPMSSYMINRHRNVPEWMLSFSFLGCVLIQSFICSIVNGSKKSEKRKKVCLCLMCPFFLFLFYFFYYFLHNNEKLFRLAAKKMFLINWLT